MKVKLLPPIRINRKCKYNKQSERWMWIERKYFRWAIIELNVILPLFVQFNLYKREWRERKWVNLTHCWILTLDQILCSIISGIFFLTDSSQHPLKKTQLFSLLYNKEACVIYCFKNFEQSFLPLSASVFSCAKRE